MSRNIWISRMFSHDLVKWCHDRVDSYVCDSIDKIQDFGATTEWKVMKRTVTTIRMREMTTMVTVTLRNQRLTLKQSTKMVMTPPRTMKKWAIMLAGSPGKCVSVCHSRGKSRQTVVFWKSGLKLYKNVWNYFVWNYFVWNYFVWNYMKMSKTNKKCLKLICLKLFCLKLEVVWN
jgi:hypothetical protein